MRWNGGSRRRLPRRREADAVKSDIVTSEVGCAPLCQPTPHTDAGDTGGTAEVDWFDSHQDTHVRRDLNHRAL